MEMGSGHLRCLVPDAIFKWLRTQQNIELRLPPVAQMFLMCLLCSEWEPHEHFKVLIEHPCWDLARIQENTLPRLGPACLPSWLCPAQASSAQSRPRLAKPSSAQPGPAQSCPPQRHLLQKLMVFKSYARTGFWSRLGPGPHKSILGSALLCPG